MQGHICINSAHDVSWLRH